jgi:NAD(P)-dependent dehydrogenase (short-subunit alcohol dehydrogenase family)
MDPADRNRVGIIGAGRLGQAMARTALRAGRSVVIANSRGPASLTSVVSALGAGASAGTVAQASAAGISASVGWRLQVLLSSACRWRTRYCISLPYPRSQREALPLHRYTDRRALADAIRTSLVAGGSWRLLFRGSEFA